MICVREGQTLSLAPYSSKLSSEARHTERELPCRMCARPLGGSSWCKSRVANDMAGFNRESLSHGRENKHGELERLEKGILLPGHGKIPKDKIMDDVDELEAHTDQAGRNLNAQPEIRAAQDT